jgi:N-acetyl-anhydromuramyl-L-alanine amidase AmpD
MRTARYALALIPFLTMPLFLSACGGEGGGITNPGTSELELQFDAAGQEFGVPSDLLKAIGYAQTRWYHVPGEVSEIGPQAPIYGVMALQGETLERGAALAHLSVEEVRTQPGANIRAAAALLSSLADELRINRKDLGAWAPAVARLHDNPNQDSLSYYIHKEVYRLLNEGIPGDEGNGMHERVAARAIVPNYPPPSDFDRGSNVIASGTIWRPSPSSNYTVGRSGYRVELLVIHTCAGAYSGCWGWLTTPYPTNPYRTSAHYVVNEAGTEVSALVDEVNTAHHVGASWQGYPTNPRSVGIEHGGQPYSGSNVWTTGQISRSASLSCDIVRRHGIIRDRNHIIGHYQPDPVNRANDPGTSFPWTDYMNRINTCIGGGSSYITVDSNNANNNSANARVLAPSANWVSSTNVAGYYGSGYWAAPTAAVSDGVHFEFYLPAAATRTVYAWWTAAADRATTTPFVMFNASGTSLGTVNRNQQVNGGSWQLLGTYNFSAGWNRVTVSRWTTAGYYVIADAIQVR